MTHAVAYIPMFNKQSPKLKSLFVFTVKANKTVCVCVCRSSEPCAAQS